MSIPDKRQERVLGAKLQASPLRCGSPERSPWALLSVLAPQSVHIWTRSREQEPDIFLAVEVWLPGDPAGLHSTDISHILTSDKPAFSRIMEQTLPSLEAAVD